MATSFLNYLENKGIYRQTSEGSNNQLDLVSAENGDDSKIITQNDFSANYTDWLKSDVFGSDEFYEYVDSLDLPNEGDILQMLSDGTFSVQLNQNSSTGSPYITELQGLIDFDALFGDSSETAVKSGKGTQERFYVSDVTIPEPNEAPTASALQDSATETLSTYDDDHVITNQDLPDDSDPKTIDLLATASDPDGDPLTVGDFHFFDENDDEITQPDYITIDGSDLTVEQNYPGLNALLDGEVLEIKVEYTISDDHGHQIDNTLDLEITGTADQYLDEDNAGSDASEAHVNPSAGANTLSGLVLTLDASDDGDTDPDYVADSFTYYDGTIEASTSGLSSGPPAENATVSDANNDDWDPAPTDESIVIRDSNSPQQRALDVAGALSDAQVDYNVGFSGQADAGDSVTVSVDYTYDYWYLA